MKFLITILVLIPWLGFSQTPQLKLYGKANVSDVFLNIAIYDSVNFVVPLHTYENNYAPVAMFLNAQGDSLHSYTEFISFGYINKYQSIGNNNFAGVGSVSNNNIDNDVLLQVLNYSSSISTLVKSFGSANNEYANDFCILPDSGYLIVGISIGTATSLYLLRTNKFGDSLWTKKIGQDDEYIWGSSIVQESDTSYLVAGTYIGNISGSNSTNDFILRINLDGDTLMFKRFPKATFDSEMKLVKNENGGYYFNSGSQLVNLDSVLNITWQKDFYYGIGGQLFDIKTTADKGCIMVGARYASYSSYDLDIYMVRINSNGDTLWTRSLSGPMKEVARGVVQTSDGGFAVVGSTDHDNLSLNGDAFFLKLNATGDITTNIGLALSLSQLGIQLYPNPAQDWLTISSTSIEDLPKGKLQLFDSQGKMVKTVAIAPHQQQLKVDVSDLSSGVYLIQIDGKSVSGSSKLIVR